MGLGDMQLAFVSGLFANSYMDLLKNFTLSFVSGAIFAIFVIIVYKKGLKTQMPFGPFIAIAILFQLMMWGFYELFIYLFKNWILIYKV